MASSTAARNSGSLIAPHGGELVNRTVTGDEATALHEQALTLPRVHMTEKQTADLDMIASGALSPLTGFMTQADYERVVEDMHLASGLPWALPVTLSVPERPTADRLALEGSDGDLLAVIEVADVFEADRSEEAAKVFRTTEDAHPGVAQVYAEGRDARRRPRDRVPAASSPPSRRCTQDPADTRATFAERGWKPMVGFQTRNPVHRAHEYIQKCALETVDGLLLHPLVGETKGDDIPADVRMALLRGAAGEATTRPTACCSPSSRRRCATPARARRSSTPSAARTTAARTSSSAATTPASAATTAPTTRSRSSIEFEPHELDIKPMFFDHSFFCRTCGNMASAKTCPHPSDDHVHLSGTKVREMLGEGEVPPVEFSRPEVAQVLIDAYRSA